MRPRRYAEALAPAFDPPRPVPAEREAWAAALGAASAFWAEAADDTRISDGFRRVCEANARQLAGLAAGA